MITIVLRTAELNDSESSSWRPVLSYTNNHHSIRVFAALLNKLEPLMSRIPNDGISMVYRENCGESRQLWAGLWYSVESDLRLHHGDSPDEQYYIESSSAI